MSAAVRTVKSVGWETGRSAPVSRETSSAARSASCGETSAGCGKPRSAGVSPPVETQSNPTPPMCLGAPASGALLGATAARRCRDRPRYPARLGPGHPEHGRGGRRRGRCPAPGGGLVGRTGQHDHLRLRAPGSSRTGQVASTSLGDRGSLHRDEGTFGLDQGIDQRGGRSSGATARGSPRRTGGARGCRHVHGPRRRAPAPGPRPPPPRRWCGAEGNSTSVTVRSARSPAPGRAGRRPDPTSQTDAPW